MGSLLYVLAVQRRGVGVFEYNLLQIPNQADVEGKEPIRLDGTIP